MGSNPFDVVKQFETALCDYTSAQYAVTTNSCTMALLLVCEYFLKHTHNHWFHRNRVVIEIPRRTYVSVPQSIIHAGAFPIFRNEDWIGEYQLKPYPIWDCARRFTAGMYMFGTFQCLSFHHSKILGDSQGGAILHDSPEADLWFRKARFDGRTEGVPPKQDTFDMVGWHCYMSPDVASRLLWKLSKLPEDNPDLPNDDYPDLSLLPIFQ